MPPKAKLPQPIDRPLSRAYLREFTGWSTAYPPGLSDPTSLRRMENIMINRDGSARIRPGLRYLSYDALPVDGGAAGTPGDGVPAGTHETFFLNSGAKAYLYAVREVDDTVGFRVLADTGLGLVVHNLTSPGVEFVITPSEAALNFTSATRYVKFLQIDNKIFALSDAGETMREFFVGANKSAKVLVGITRPDWTVADKLTVVHPDATWTNSGVPISSRTNLWKNPSFETAPSPSVEAGPYTSIGRSSTVVRDDTYSLAMSSLPEKTNYCPRPLGDIAAYGITGWTKGSNTTSIGVSFNWLIANLATGPIGQRGYVGGPMTGGIVAGEGYGFRIHLRDFTNIQKVGMLVRFYNSSNVQVGSDIVYAGSAPSVGQKSFGPATAPAGATKVRMFPFGTRSTTAALTNFSFDNAMTIDAGAPDTFYDGDNGANYFWTGTVNNSSSVYHPPKDITYQTEVASAAVAYMVSVYVRAGSVVRNTTIGFTGSGFAPDVADVVGSWTRISRTGTAIANTTITVKIKAVPRGETHYIDSGLMEAGAALNAYFSGATPDIVGTVYDWTGTAHASSSTEKVYTAATTLPPPETKTVNTLISSAAADNDYNFGFFYTFNNEIGETWASQATIVKTQRPWSGWMWEAPNAAGEPDPAAPVVDPTLAADQLAAYMPLNVFTEALAAGAIQWNLYMFTWSNQEPVPVSALKVGYRTLTAISDHDEVGWISVTPAQSDYGTETALLPSASRINYSEPSRGGQGLVAADRMVLVKDPTAQAVIRWTSNQQGSYTDFTANKGGGFKTLTSGNLMIPACVKLWQNPQSADTLTILCMGVDGHSTGYYMAPAQVASQSEATNIMGFEETTATPGTTSPYGVEVFNNTLYHPLDEQLMKSSASNYNINHKSVTDQIQDRWRGLQNKQWIVSSQHDNRLYFIVHNPRGVPLEDNCNGNEIWVFDGMAEAGNWSRFLIQAVSLRKIEQLGKVVMSVVRPDGIYYLDENYGSDDYVSAGVVASRAIPWYLETNTQGANRAHDAWCHLQQVSLIAGNFTGTMRYGIRSYDINGKPVEIAKVFRDLNPPDLSYTFDIQDNLQIRRDLVEWFFFAESVLDDAEEVLPSFGQLNLVQYKYAPVTVNVGYEYGSIETFEYGRATVNWDQRTTDNGVPQPMTDTRRP